MLSLSLHAQECALPPSLKGFLRLESNILTSDMRRHAAQLERLCYQVVSFDEGSFDWKMLLVWSPSHPKGAFWYLPHDNENTAFSSAIYATVRYGGGFLSVINEDKRIVRGQDPNRNFGTTPTQSRKCSQQKYPAPLYVSTLFRIIDTFRDKRYPYLTLHTNSNAHAGNGGAGHVSMLKRSSSVLSFPARGIKRGRRLGLRDEDSLIYIATAKSNPDTKRVKMFNDLGINVKYEMLNPRRNDCSMSHYVVLELGSEAYINIEVEHGDKDTQRVMIEKILSLY